MRVFEEGDTTDLFGILGSFETVGAMSSGVLEDEAAVGAWIDRRRAEQGQRAYSLWAVELNATGTVIGDCGFLGRRGDALELGYVIGHTHWGQGYASEAASAAIAHAFDTLQAESIEATIRPWNTRSIGVARRVSMEYLGTEVDDRGDLWVIGRRASQ